eukprot:TRINITY_DN10467_c0_g1_i2.p1 TRINITY_DN10467_c0_g1~~TRINITY_DN10467_c0_g1_i2.p1  ORF type:complete len:227 (+),score=30.58 TRINITY_DN10467_c0_g1_i2:208-888(+)
MLYGRPGGRRGRSVGQNGRCDDSVSVSSPSFASSSKRLAAELGSARRTLWSGPEAWRAPALGPTTIRAGAPTPSAGDARDEAVTAEAEANDAAAAAVRRSAPNSAVKCRHQNDIDRGDTDISRAGSMANRRLFLGDVTLRLFLRRHGSRHAAVACRRRFDQRPDYGRHGQRQLAATGAPVRCLRILARNEFWRTLQTRAVQVRWWSVGVGVCHRLPWPLARIQAAW